MVSQTVRVNNPSGLHLRPAGNLCNLALQFDSEVTFDYPEGNANAKSVLSVLGACVKQGDEITLICRGEDEEKALKTLVEAIEGGLGEDNPETSEQSENPETMAGKTADTENMGNTAGSGKTEDACRGGGQV